LTDLRLASETGTAASRRGGEEERTRVNHSSFTLNNKKKKEKEKEKEKSESVKQAAAKKQS